MMAKVLRRLGGLVAMLALTGAPLGCDGTPAPKLANVTPGDLPSGAKWDGVYYNELFGYLHVKQEGTKIRGKWERRVKDRWGELKGEATGDVLKFEWNEYIRGLVGPNAKKTGKGYFKYKRPPGDNVDDNIVGEIGAGQDEVGETWEAVKQRNIPPDLASIGGSGAMDVGGGDWDTDPKEKGKPEAPQGPK